MEGTGGPERKVQLPDDPRPRPNLPFSTEHTVQDLSPLHSVQDCGPARMNRITRFTDEVEPWMAFKEDPRL